MNESAKEKFIKEQVEKHQEAVNANTEKAVKDAINNTPDPPESDSTGNAVIGAVVGTIVAGPIGLVIGGAIGSTIENDEKEEYDEVYKKTKEELNKKE
jgi:hypothetical protein